MRIMMLALGLVLAAESAEPCEDALRKERYLHFSHLKATQLLCAGLTTDVGFPEKYPGCIVMGVDRMVREAETRGWLQKEPHWFPGKP